jgi:hypothetical protein
MSSPSFRPRLLLIEDSPHRIDIFRRWLAGSEFILIEASSAGRALGLLRKGMTDGIAGLCLDHDLDQQPVTESDLRLSASNLMSAITLSLPRSTPVLIHSMNVQKPVIMKRMLKSAGFSVTRTRFVALTQMSFENWLDEVRDNFEE